MAKIFSLLCMVFFLFSACQTLPQGKPAANPDDGISQIVRSLAAQPQVKGKNVGVGDFVDSKGEVSPRSREIASRVEVELSKAATQGQFQLINRQNFVQLAKEWELNLSGAVDPSTAKKVGSLLGIDVLLTGNLLESGEGSEVAAKALETETGKVLWAERAKMKLEKEPAALFPREVAPVREGEIKIQLWSDRPTYRVGESMTLFFKASQDCYVTLIDAGTSGKAHILYPNRFSGGSKVLAGKTYSIPGKEDGYAITVGGPAGTEVVRAIATLTPIPFVDSDFSKSQEVFKGVQNPALLTRDLSIVATKTEPASRGEGLIRIEIKE